MLIVLKSASLKLLEPSGPVKVCNGIALPQMLTQYHSGDQIEKDEMGGLSSTYGGEQRCIQDFGGET